MKLPYCCWIYPLPFGILAESINSGVWQPPENLPELSCRVQASTLHAVSLAGMVVAAPLEPVTHPQRRRQVLPPNSLTPRQKEVLAFLTEGLTNRQIAAQLGISVRTVGFHVQKLKARLNTRSRYQAAASLGRGDPSETGGQDP